MLDSSSRRSARDAQYRFESAEQSFAQRETSAKREPAVRDTLAGRRTNRLSRISLAFERRRRTDRGHHERAILPPALVAPALNS